MMAAAAASSPSDISSQAMTAVKHASKCMTPVTIEMLLNATIDVSDNVVLEDGYCPLQFRTHGYITEVQSTDQKLSLQLIGLLTERTITATLLFDDATHQKQFAWLRRGHHVQIIGILKRTATKLRASQLSLDGPPKPIVAGTGSPEDVVRFISIYHIQRVYSPLDGDIFLKEALVCAKRRVMGIGPTLAQTPRTNRVRDRQPVYLRFLTQRLRLTDNLHKRIYLPVTVENADASLLRLTAITPFAAPIEIGSPYCTIPVVDCSSAFIVGASGVIEFPKAKDTCVLIGSMQDMHNFQANLCISYPTPISGKSIDLTFVAKLRNSDLHPHLPESELLLLC